VLSVQEAFVVRSPDREPAGGADGVTVFGDDEDRGLRAGADGDREPEVGREPSIDALPGESAIAAAVGAQVVLLEEDVGIGRVDDGLMDAAMDTRMRNRTVRERHLRKVGDTLVDRIPRDAVVVRAEQPGAGDAGVDAAGPGLWQDDRVEA
jgi:hypothetical protein